MSDESGLDEWSLESANRQLREKAATLQAELSHANEKVRQLVEAAHGMSVAIYENARPDETWNAVCVARDTWEKAKGGT
jgi:hypothetical protein